MYKFLKSKKGFTLVELMIVVVIMAILVAVAVPIYSAVTKKAREKTCADNRRQIVSAVNTWCMNNQKNITAHFEIKTTADETGAYDDTKMTGFTDDDYTQIKGLFQATPYCPNEGNVIQVDLIENAAAESTPTIKVYCTEHEPKA